MNWELKNGHKDTVQDFLAGKFSEMLIYSLENDLDKLGTFAPVCEPAVYTEWPDGFIRHPKDGVGYRMIFNVGFYRGGKFVSLNPPKYSMQVTKD